MFLIHAVLNNNDSKIRCSSLGFGINIDHSDLVDSTSKRGKTAAVHEALGFFGWSCFKEVFEVCLMLFLWWMDDLNVVVFKTDSTGVLVCLPCSAVPQSSEQHRFPVPTTAAVT